MSNLLAAHRWRAVVLLVVLLALTGCAARDTQPTEPTPTLAEATATQEPTTAPTPTPVPPTATPLPPTPTSPPPSPTPLSSMAILEAASTAMDEVQSYHFDMTADMAISGPNLDLPMGFTFEGDVQNPDQLQGTMVMTAAGTSAETEMVMLGDVAYVTNPETGEWEITQQPETALDPQEFTTFDLSRFGDMELVGQETLGDSDVYHLRGEMSIPLDLGDPLGQIEAVFQVEYWIDQEDYLAVQSTLAGEIALPAEIEGSLAMSMTMTMTDYDEAVNIVAPEGPVSGLSVFDAALEALNQVDSYHFAILVDYIQFGPDQAVELQARQEVDGNYQAPNLVAGDMTMETLGEGAESEVMTIGSTEYTGRAEVPFVVEGTTEYVQIPSTGEWEINTAPTIYVPNDLMPFDDELIYLVGTDTLDGAPVYHLQGSGSLEEEIEVSYQDEYWIGQEDGRLWKAVHQERHALPGEEGPSAVISVTMVIDDYDVPVTIEVPELAAATGPQAAQGGNLRAGPGTNYEVVGSIAAGDALELTGRNQAGDWLVVRTADGSEAWIAAFLVENVELDDLSVKEAPQLAVVPPESTPATAASDNYQGIPIMPGVLDVDTSEEGFYLYLVAPGIDEVRDWYDARMAAEGWNQGMRMEVEDGYMLFYGRGDSELVAVSIQPVPELGGTVVLLHRMAEPGS